MSAIELIYSRCGLLRARQNCQRRQGAPHAWICSSAFSLNPDINHDLTEHSENALESYKVIRKTASSEATEKPSLNVITCRLGCGGWPARQMGWS